MYVVRLIRAWEADVLTLASVLFSTEESWKVTEFTKLQLKTTSWEAFALLGYYAPYVGIFFYRHFGTAYRPHLQALRNFSWTVDPWRWNLRTVPKWHPWNSRLWKNGWNICSRYWEQSGKTFYFGYAKGWKCYKCSVWYCGSIVTRVVLYNTI